MAGAARLGARTFLGIAPGEPGPCAWPGWPCGARPLPPSRGPESCRSGFAFLPLLRAAAKLVERQLHLLKRSGLPGGIGLARDDDRGAMNMAARLKGRGNSVRSQLFRNT